MCDCVVKASLKGDDERRMVTVKLAAANIFTFIFTNGAMTKTLF